MLFYFNTLLCDSSCMINIMTRNIVFTQPTTLHNNFFLIKVVKKQFHHLNKIDTKVTVNITLKFCRILHRIQHRWKSDTVKRQSKLFVTSTESMPAGISIK